jgi:aerobic-type carbon monoxide dehydrogenase small subunit (CoxS/CutS family)
MAFTLKVSGTTRSVDVDSDAPLLRVLRDMLGMTGTKFGAESGCVAGKRIRTLPIATTQLQS